MINKILSKYEVTIVKSCLNCSTNPIVRLMHKASMDDPQRLNEGSRFERRIVNVTSSPMRRIQNDKDKVFNVASYNVLSQHLLDRHPEHYTGCKQEYLSWRYRSNQIIEEIVHFMPDIICLQEVHFNHYKMHFMKTLNTFGYFGKYKRRPGYENEDGCATFFKVSRFSLKETKAVVYDDYDKECEGRSNVAMLTVLAFKSNQRHICIANTHLLYNPKRGDIKLTQLSIILAELHALAYKYSKKDNKNSMVYKTEGTSRQSVMKHQHSKQVSSQCGILLCGDFNLVPFSPLHYFLTHGSIETSNFMTAQLSGNLQTHQKMSSQPLNSTSFLPSQINSKCQFISKKGITTEHLKVTEDQQNVATNSIQQTFNPNQQILCNILNNTASAPTTNTTSTSHRPPYLTHTLSLMSAYPHLVQVDTHNAHYTDMQVSQSHPNEPPKTVDYIFYGVDEKRSFTKYGLPMSEVKRNGPLKLLSYLQLAVASSNLGAMPNHINGSDHLLIMAEFLLN